MSTIPWRDVGPGGPVPDELGGGDVAGRGGGGSVASSVAAASGAGVGEAVDVDALELLADVGKLVVRAVRRGFGPAVKEIMG